MFAFLQSSLVSLGPVLKKPNDATTLKEIEEIFKLQKK